jgi:recombination protein RecT
MNLPAKQQKMATVRDLLTKMKDQIALAVPRHVDPERLARVALTTIQKTPRLMECTERSLLGAIMDAAQLGLDVDGILGHAYLVPYKVRGTMLAQLQVGYRGFIALARRSGEVSEFYSYTVHENDDWKYALGLNRTLHHVPAAGERGQLIASYAVLRYKDGGFDFEVMTKSEIDKIRNQSKAKDNGPWVTHYDEMARKTPIRRLAKRAPVSTDFQRAAVLDEYHDAGVIDVTPEEVKTKTETKIEELKTRLAEEVPQAEEPAGQWDDTPPPEMTAGSDIGPDHPWHETNWKNLRRGSEQQDGSHSGFWSYVFEHRKSLGDIGGTSALWARIKEKFDNFYSSRATLEYNGGAPRVIIKGEETNDEPVPDMMAENPPPAGSSTRSKLVDQLINLREENLFAYDQARVDLDLPVDVDPADPNLSVDILTEWAYTAAQ